MRSFNLVPHPDHPPLAVRGVEVEVIETVDDLLLTYRVRGTDKLLTPPWVFAARADDLWRTTCFELFLKPSKDESYFEWNFSPSTLWSSYAFVGYREGVSNFVQDVAPFIEKLSDGIEVDCDLGGTPLEDLDMGLSAVLEETDGIKSYWALAHPPGPPDFHHPACFTARLPAPERP